MNRRTTFLLAAAAATTLVGAASAAAAPTTFEKSLNAPAAVSAYDGTVLYASRASDGDEGSVGPFALQRSVDGAAPSPFRAALSFTEAAPTFDIGPSAHGSIAHPYGSPVAIFRDGTALTTISAQSGRQLGSLAPSPAPTGDVSTYQGRIAYLAGTGTRKRIIVRLQTLGLAYSTYDESTGGCEAPCTVGLTGPRNFRALR